MLLKIETAIFFYFDSSHKICKLNNTTYCPTGKDKSSGLKKSQNSIIYLKMFLLLLVRNYLIELTSFEQL